MDHSSQLILITGSSGHVGAHVLSAFLVRGYNTRVAVRSQSSADKISQMLAKTYPSYQNQLSFAVVPDFTVPGAFDEAVRNVHGIIHVASPLRMDSTDVVRDILDPAIKGTTNILSSAHHHGPDIHRIIITGSMVSVLPFRRQLPSDQVLTEADWMDIDYDTAVELAHPGIAYAASKVLAERAATEYVEKYLPHFSVTSVVPPHVFGPQISPLASTKDLNITVANVHRLVSGAELAIPKFSMPTFVDARDLAEAHLRAFETEGAGGQRYLVCGDGVLTGQKIVDILTKRFPELGKKMPVVEPGNEEGVRRFSNEKAKRELGIKFRTLEETVVDTAECVLKLEKELED